MSKRFLSSRASLLLQHAKFHFTNVIEKLILRFLLDLQLLSIFIYFTNLIQLRFLCLFLLGRGDRLTDLSRLTNLGQSSFTDIQVDIQGRDRFPSTLRGRFLYYRICKEKKNFFFYDFFKEIFNDMGIFFFEHRKAFLKRKKI